MYKSWSPQEINDLISEPLKITQQKHPEKTRNQLRTLRNYYIKKLRKIKVEKPEQESRLYKTWEVSAFNSKTEEWTTATNHGYEYTPDPQTLAEVYTPATPAKITPTKRKPLQRDFRLYVAMGDAQMDFRRLDDNTLEPIHDERAMRASRLLCADIRPNEIVNLGDNVDLSSLSRFAPDSDHFHRTLGPSFQRAHDFYAELRADNPQAKIVEVSSNHEVRLRNWVLKNMPQIYGVKRPGQEDDYPVMTYPYLANLLHVGVEWVGGYGAAEYKIGGNEDLIARHGNETRTKTQSAASKIMGNYSETNNIHGHAHEMSLATRTLRNGKMLTSIAVGALCRTDGVVPSYHNAVDDNNLPVKRQENWSQGIAVIYDYGDSRYQFDNVPIHNGIIVYNGKVYDGNIND